MKTTSDRPTMEGDLKILKVEYLNNHWSDLPQIPNLGLGDQTKIKIGLKFEMKTTSDWSLMEDNLKILKVVYLSNHWSDLPQILDLSPWHQTKIKLLEMMMTSIER